MVRDFLLFSFYNLGNSIFYRSGGQVFIVKGERFDLIQHPRIKFLVYPQMLPAYVSTQLLLFCNN